MKKILNYKFSVTGSATNSFTIFARHSLPIPQFSHLRNLLVRVTKLPLRVQYFSVSLYATTKRSTVTPKNMVIDEEKTIFHSTF